MRVRITRTWQAADEPSVKLEAGQVMTVDPLLAKYLLAMNIAEVLDERNTR
jgi:hypothetical protein